MKAFFQLREETYLKMRRCPKLPSGGTEEVSSVMWVRSQAPWRSSVWKVGVCQVALGERTAREQAPRR